MPTLGPADRPCRGPSDREIIELPTLVPVQTWPSKRRRPRQSISLVTQLSIDRLPALENQCITWPDHLVAVVYVPMVANSSGGPPLLPLYRRTTLADVIESITFFQNYMETTAACAFHIDLVGQFIPPGIFPGLYPINALRNRAMRLAPTDLAILVDADFVVTPLLGLSGAGYRDPAVYREMQERATKKQVLVLPSLELTNKWQDLTLSRSIARDMVLAGKKMARGALEGGILAPYVESEEWLEREMKAISRWADSSAYRKINIDPHAEPCVLVSLSTVPWFDERFVDDGAGAATWFTYLMASNFHFSLHPDAFAVHVPHVRPRPKKRFLETQKRLRQGRMTLLEQQVVAEMHSESHVPVLCECPPRGSEGAEGVPSPLWDSYISYYEALSAARVEEDLAFKEARDNGLLVTETEEWEPVGAGENPEENDWENATEQGGADEDVWKKVAEEAGGENNNAWDVVAKEKKSDEGAEEGGETDGAEETGVPEAIIEKEIEGEELDGDLEGSAEESVYKGDEESTKEEEKPEEKETAKRRNEHKNDAHEEEDKVAASPVGYEDEEEEEDPEEAVGTTEANPLAEEELREKDA